MPIYEFRCGKCGHVFEALRPMGDDGKRLRCPRCGAPGPSKKVSAFSTSSGSSRAPGGVSTGCGSGGFT